MTPKQIKEKLKTDGFIKLRSGYYRIVQANEETIESQALLQQLKDEGKCNYWISTYDFKTKTTTAPLPNVVLPICGDPDKYVTKWFYKDFDTALNQALKDLKTML